MPRTRTFTERHVAEAKPGRTHVFDTRGLYLFVSPKGVKRYLYRYTVPKQKRVTETSVGRPGIPLAKAKEIAAKYAQLLNDGIDPQEAKRLNQAEMITFGELGQQYIEMKYPEAQKQKPNRHRQEAIYLIHVHG